MSDNINILEKLNERHMMIRSKIFKALDGCSYHYAKCMLEEIINDLDHEAFVDGC